MSINIRNGKQLFSEFSFGKEVKGAFKARKEILYKRDTREEDDQSLEERSFSPLERIGSLEEEEENRG